MRSLSEISVQKINEKGQFVYQGKEDKNNIKPKVYYIKNILNGKMYIGATIQDIRTRITRHRFNALKVKGNSYLYEEIRNHGIDNFYYDILEFCERSELKERECFYIEKYDTFNTGYNCTTGDINTKVNKASRDKISKSMTNNKKLSKPIISYDLNGKIIKTFPSISEAARYYEISKRDISNVLSGKIKSTKLLRFRYKAENIKKLEVYKIYRNNYNIKKLMEA